MSKGLIWWQAYWRCETEHHPEYDNGRNDCADELEPIRAELLALLASMRGKAEPAWDYDEAADELERILHGSD